tara:strand:+ start:71 stop:175 length:105 start_codon:yes stop_codon:yes gene_type:complete
MFETMTERVDDMEDNVKVILIRIQEMKDKLDQLE